MRFELDEYLKELETLVNTDSGSRVEGGPGLIADYFEEKYRALGLDIKREAGPEGIGPFMEIRNKKEKTDVLFLGHMDTVFPKGEAAKRPFRIEGNLAYGPGVMDMKAGLLFIYHAVKNLVESGTDLGFCVALNSDEEISSVHSQKRIQELASQTKYTFVLEPGRKNGAYVYERKGLARYKMTVKGIAAHAGVAPWDGASAVNEAARAVLKMEGLNHYEIGTSVNVGKISGGTTANVVCDHVEAMIDTRFETIEENQKIENAFREIMENPFDRRTSITIEREGFRPPMRKTEKTEKLMALMEEQGKEMGMEILWAKTGGGSDGNFAAFAGSTVIDGAGPAGDGAHSQNETLQIDTIRPRFELLFKTLAKLSEEKE